MGNPLLLLCTPQYTFYEEQHFIDRKMIKKSSPRTVNYDDQRVYHTGDNTVEVNDKSSMVLVLTFRMSTLFSDHRKINHQTANARITRKDIMKGIRGDDKVLE